MAAREELKVLGSLPLFEGLSPAELAQIDQLLHRSQVPTGTHFITADQPGEVVYVLLADTVKIYVNRSDGREVILTFLGPGDTVGEMSLVDSAGRSANVMTTEPSKLVWLDRATFQSCLRSMAPLANNLVRLLANRLRFANEQIQALCTLDVPGRVARQILALSDRYGTARKDEVVIPIRLTQSDLADLVGASRERVNQVIVELKSRGAISVDSNHRIHVHNPGDLARYCG